MSTIKVGYSFADGEAKIIDTPSKEAVRAIRLLVENTTEIPGGPPLRYKQWRGINVTLVPEALRRVLTRLSQGSAERDAASVQSEEIQMREERHSDADFQQFRSRLKLIVDNPQLAEEAFPDPMLRKAVLPMIDDLRAANSADGSGDTSK